MLHVTLHLRYTDQPRRAAAAWFLPGDDPRAWLEELAQWPSSAGSSVPLQSLALYVVPRSRADRRPCGLLVVPPDGSVPSGGLRGVSRAEPYGRIGRRLYLPLAARLEPFVTEPELDALVVGELSVFHPAAGLVSFEATDVRHVCDLLTPPLRRGVAWDRARPGVAAPPKLLVVAALTPPTIDKVLYTWQDDIGSLGPEELPPVPGEPAWWSLRALGEQIRDAWSRFRERRATSAPTSRITGPARRGVFGGALRRVFRPLAWLAGIAAVVVVLLFLGGWFADSPPSSSVSPAQPPQTTSKPTTSADPPRSTSSVPHAPPSAKQPSDLPGLFPGLFAALVVLLAMLVLLRRGQVGGAGVGGVGAGGWAGARSSRVDAARQREINRLLHLLDNDPDQGLRFALPIAGGGHRGLTRPGGRLAPREVNFNLRRIGAGGGPADPWVVPWDVHQRLQDRYRKLADRELRLGRHRRAAYIFAELLGDVSAAADALTQGHHHHEAAILYRDRLNRPLDAARAFERCSVWDKAIELYVAQQQFETAGDVLLRIERPEEAAAMYRRQVAKLTDAGDRLGAAAFLERKLQAPDEAVALLAAAWPDTNQARLCLKELFRLLGRLGRHDDAAALVTKLQAQPPHVRLPAVCDVLAGVATTYPARKVGLAAADATRVLAGRRLERAGDAESKELVGYVRALVPQDELLGRDAARFLARDVLPPANVANAVAHKLRSARGKPGVEHIGRFRLPTDVNWQVAVGMGDVFYAAGFHRRGVTLVRGSWEGKCDRIDWSVPSAESHRLLFEPGFSTSAPMALVLAGGPPLAVEQFSATSDWLWPVRCGTPGCATPDVQAISYSEHGVAWTIDEQLLLRARHPDGGPLATHFLPFAETAAHDVTQDHDAELPPLVVARRSQVFVAFCRTLFTMAHERITTLDLPDDARRLVASAHSTTVRLAVGFAGGGALVVWDGPHQAPSTTRIGDGISRPELVFLLDGRLVVHDERQGRLYAPAEWTYVEQARFDGPFRPLVALLRGPRPQEFATLTADGSVQVCRVLEG